ncbi:MAG: phosphodiesterase [Alphaproteobacteria bacterium]
MLIAHFSDMHVTVDGEFAFEEVDTAGALERCIQHVNALDPAPDVVLITGDLTFNGDIQEYATLRAHLSILDAPYFLIPGNHDRRDRLRAAFADLAYLPIKSEFIHYVVDDYPLRLIALDTVHPGRVGGLLCEDRLEWLEHKLSINTDKPTIILMHHPPFKTGIEYMDRTGLANASSFADIVSKNNQIRLILCGHVHRPIQTNWSGAAVMTAPATAHQISLELRSDEQASRIMEPPAIYLHLWGPGGLISHISYIGDYRACSPFSAGYLASNRN